MIALISCSLGTVSFPYRLFPLSFPIPSDSRVSVSLSGRGSFTLIVLRGRLPALKRPVVSGAFVGVVALPARVDTLDLVGLSCCFDCFVYIIPRKCIRDWDVNISAYGPQVYGHLQGYDSPCTAVSSRARTSTYSASASLTASTKRACSTNEEGSARAVVTLCSLSVALTKAAIKPWRSAAEHSEVWCQVF